MRPRHERLGNNVNSDTELHRSDAFNEAEAVYGLASSKRWKARVVDLLHIYDMLRPAEQACNSILRRQLQSRSEPP